VFNINAQCTDIFRTTTQSINYRNRPLLREQINWDDCSNNDGHPFFVFHPVHAKRASSADLIEVGNLVRLEPAPASKPTQAEKAHFSFPFGLSRLYKDVEFVNKGTKCRLFFLPRSLRA